MSVEKEDINDVVKRLREQRYKEYQTKLIIMAEELQLNRQSSTNILDSNNMAFRRIISPGAEQKPSS